MEKDKDESIVEAAISHIKNHPSKWLSIDELCSGLSISKRTFYEYFETKNKLIEKIIQKLVGKWKKESTDSVIDVTDTKNTFLAVYTYHLNEILNFNSDFINTLRHKFPGEYVIMDEYFAEVRKRLLGILEDGRKRKEIKEGYNLEVFIEKEIAFFEYLQKKHHQFPAREDYIRLLNLSLDGIVVRG